MDESKTCGGCKHSKLQTNPMNGDIERACYYNPPTCFAVSHSTGFLILSISPTVNSGRLGCSFWEEREGKESTERGNNDKI